MVREELVVPEVLVGNHCPRWRTLKKKYYNYNICNKNSANFKIEIQWGSEQQPFEYWKNLKNKLFEVWISNGWLFKWLDVICTRSTIWQLDQYIRKQDAKLVRQTEPHCYQNKKQWLASFEEGWLFFQRRVQQVNVDVTIK